MSDPSKNAKPVRRPAPDPATWGPKVRAWLLWKFGCRIFLPHMPNASAVWLRLLHDAFDPPSLKPTPRDAPADPAEEYERALGLAEEWSKLPPERRFLLEVAYKPSRQGAGT